MIVPAWIAISQTSARFGGSSRSIDYAFGVGLANFGADRSRLASDVAEMLPLIALDVDPWLVFYDNHVP